MEEKIGRKDDAEKPRWDLLPLEQVEKIVEILTFGAKKYSENEWQNLANPKPRYYAALMRHICRWFKGERIDPESGKPHLAHAACCVLFLMWFDGKENK